MFRLISSLLSHRIERLVFNCFDFDLPGNWAHAIVDDEDLWHADRLSEMESGGRHRQDQITHMEFSPISSFNGLRNGEASPENANGNSENCYVLSPDYREPGDFMETQHGRTHYFLKGPIEDRRSPLVLLLHGASVFSFIYMRFAHLLASRGYRVLMFGKRSSTFLRRNSVAVL